MKAWTAVSTTRPDPQRIGQIRGGSLQYCFLGPVIVLPAMRTFHLLIYYITV